MKKFISILLVLSMVFGMSTSVFADVGELSHVEKYKFNSIAELKEELNSLESKELKADEMEMISKKTDPLIIKAFIEEKQKKADELLNNSEELVIDNDQTHYEKTFDLGDNCWIKFTIDNKKIPNTFEKVKNFFVPSVYAFSKSGYKTGWQDYGKYTYTAVANANYGVAGGTYRLQVYYTLSATGIKVTDEIASALDETLLEINVTQCKTTDDVATKPGASDCNSYAIFKTTYGYDPIDWSRTHKMNLRIKYLAKDATVKKIHNTREWSIAPYNPS